MRGQFWIKDDKKKMNEKEKKIKKFIKIKPLGTEFGKPLGTEFVAF